MLQIRTAIGLRHLSLLKLKAPSQQYLLLLPNIYVFTPAGFFDKDKVESMMDESLKMKRFKHPNVLGLIGVCLDADPAPYVVMPYMANGSLLHYLKKERSNVVLSPEVDEDVVSAT